jgi:hypothetical protein
MNAAGECLPAISGPSAGGFPVNGLDLDLALSLAEKLSRFPGGQSAISFLDAGLMARCLVSPSQRNALAHHLVLPAEGTLSNLLFKAMGAKNLNARISATIFVPALLTYAERTMKVAVWHDNPGKAEQLRHRLQRHAPWHDVVLAGDEAIEHCDLMIVQGRRHPEGRGFCAGSARPVKANLTIFADARLQLSSD